MQPNELELFLVVIKGSLCLASLERHTCGAYLF